MSALTPLYLKKLQYINFFLNKREMVMYQGQQE